MNLNFINVVETIRNKSFLISSHIPHYQFFVASFFLNSVNMFFVFLFYLSYIMHCKNCFKLFLEMVEIGH